MDLGPYAPQGSTPLLPKLSVTSKVSAPTSHARVGSLVHFRSSEDVTLLELTSPIDREERTSEVRINVCSTDFEHWLHFGSFRLTCGAYGPWREIHNVYYSYVDVRKTDVFFQWKATSYACRCMFLYLWWPPRCLVVKVSTSRAEDSGFESCLCRDFLGVEPYQWLKNWHSSGYPARCLVLQGQCWDWLAQCQNSVTGWDIKFGLQLLSQCGST